MAAAYPGQLPSVKIPARPAMDKPTFYEIRVNGHLDETWTDWFSTLTVSNLENGQAVISGFLQDQAALQGVLKRLVNLGLTLVALNQISDAELSERRKEQSDECYDNNQ